jgi:hypothetical protein
MSEISDIIDVKTNRVRFGENELKIYEDEKINNFNDEYRKNREENVRLARMEYYFRKMNLLGKDEMISFSCYPHRHIRGPFLDQIAYDRQWIDRDEYLQIYTK